MAINFVNDEFHTLYVWNLFFLCWIFVLHLFLKFLNSYVDDFYENFKFSCIENSQFNERLKFKFFKLFQGTVQPPIRIIRTIFSKSHNMLCNSFVRSAFEFLLIFNLIPIFIANFFFSCHDVIKTAYHTLYISVQIR